MIERRTRDRKVSGSSPGMSGGRIFFLMKSTFCADSLFSVSVPTPYYVEQLHVKDPGHSAKSVGGYVQLNTHAP